MFIVIEGLDGVGKSTVTKALAKALDAHLLSTPDETFKGVREQLEVAYRHSYQARQLFYASTVVAISDKISHLIAKGEHVIVDRYWLSTQVYHHWKMDGGHFKLSDVENSLIKPDLTIYLQLPLAQRKQRIEGRHESQNSAEDNLTLTNQADNVLNQLYENNRHADIAGQWLVVDTSDSIETIMVTLLDNISSLLGNQILKELK